MRLELMILILAGLILNRIMLTEKTVDITNQDDMVATRIGVTAVSIANSYVDRVTGSRLSFDEFTTGNAVEPTSADSSAKLSLLSWPLGKDAGELSQRQFDDIDDYDGLDTMLTLPDAGSFRVRCSVQYFDPAKNSTTTYRRWFKQLSFTVTDTIPGSGRTYFRFNGTKAEVSKSVVVGFYKFLH